MAYSNGLFILDNEHAVEEGEGRTVGVGIVLVTIFAQIIVTQS
jgi:hypothetical protein